MVVVFVGFWVKNNNLSYVVCYVFLGIIYMFSFRYFVNENWCVCLDVWYVLL